jgi:DNA-binding beta-propeller fold protein YncE
VTCFANGHTCAVHSACLNDRRGWARAARATMAFLLVWCLVDAAAAPTAGEPEGSLRQLAGGAGCLEYFGKFCRDIRGLDASGDIAVAPDGRHVYVGSEASSVIAFARQRETGALRPLPGKRGCIRWKGGRGCSTARAFNGPRAIAISRDGGSVYVGANSSFAVAVFSRDRATGRLRQLPGRAGCVGIARGCTYRNIGNIDGLALSPDGRSLYSWDWYEGTISVFLRGGKGLVRPSRRRLCRGAAGGGCTASALAVSPDGRHVYMAVPHQDEAGISTGGVVKGFRRRRDGTLVQLPGVAGCLAQRYPAAAEEGCGSAVGLGFATDIAIAPGGRTMYVSDGARGSIAIFRRDPLSGALSQARGGDACVSWFGRGGCTPARGIGGPRDLAVTHDGRNLYVAARGSSALAMFSTGGGLRQLPGRYGCVKVRGGEGCKPGRGLYSANEVAVSRDGVSVYAGASAGGGYNRMAIFRRTTASR